jgi:hypothetical protein
MRRNLPGRSEHGCEPVNIEFFLEKRATGQVAGADLP